jgi:hypothetical protein
MTTSCRHRAAAAARANRSISTGGNRLRGLRQALVGAARLDPEQRRKISLPVVHFGARWLSLAELEQRQARTDRRRYARHMRQCGYLVLPHPSWWRQP